jgi:hypothetical protein
MRKTSHLFLAGLVNKFHELEWLPRKGPAGSVPPATDCHFARFGGEAGIEGEGWASPARILPAIVLLADGAPCEASLVVIDFVMSWRSICSRAAVELRCVMTCRLRVHGGVKKASPALRRGSVVVIARVGTGESMQKQLCGGAQ